MLQVGFNDLIIQYSDPATLLCQVNALSSKKNELTQFEILQIAKPFLEMLPKIAQK